MVKKFDSPKNDIKQCLKKLLNKININMDNNENVIGREHEYKQIYNKIK